MQKHLHDWKTDPEHGHPLVQIQGHDGEETLQEGRVENAKVEGHGQRDGIHQHHILPQRKREQGLARGECIHGVQHLNHDQNRKGHGRGCFAHLVAEHLTPDLGELGRALVEVCLEYALD